jgi:hypothetical protein
LPPTPQWHRDRHLGAVTGRARPSDATNTIRVRPPALRRLSVETAATGAEAAATVEVEAQAVVAAEVVSVVIEAEVAPHPPGAQRYA